jgi:hypothetical protein
MKPFTILTLIIGENIVLSWESVCPDDAENNSARDVKPDTDC